MLRDLNVYANHSGTTMNDNEKVSTPAGTHPPRNPRVELALNERLEGLWKKNRGLVANPTSWRLASRLLAAKARTSYRPAMVTEKPGVMFVSTHHKAMTTYFHAVLRPLCLALSIPFDRVNSELPDPTARLFLSMQGKQDFKALGAYRGIHVMRDPRDMIVSGYHYHKWTHESWVHRLDDQGESYQEKLNRLDKRDGLFLEIQHFIFFYRSTLERWDMSDQHMLEVSYESLMGPERDSNYTEIFTHLGFESAELDLAVDLMRLFEAESRSGKRPGAVSKRSHMRSGKPRQWETDLAPEHLDYINQELGQILEKFGYR